VFNYVKIAQQNVHCFSCKTNKENQINRTDAYISKVYPKKNRNKIYILILFSSVFETIESETGTVKPKKENQVFSK
jgi:hypothetical protein